MIISNLLKVGERFDNRKPEEVRIFEIEQVANSSLIRMGKSQLLVAFQKSVVKPYLDKPQEGIVNLNVSFGSRKHDKISNLLHRIYIKQKCIDLESLCIRFNEEVTSIHMDLRVLSSDEGIYTLAIAGVNSVLKTLGVPLNFLPQCFFYCSVGGVIISDPSECELEESKWSCIVVVKSHREILFLEKIGEEFHAEDLFEVVERSLGSYSVEK